VTILALNFYYAKPGQEDAVKRQRIAASDVRDRLKISRGRALWLLKGTPALPTVIWACEFADPAAHERDMWTRHYSPEFEAIRAGMRALYVRFERVLYQVEDGAPAAMLQPFVWQSWWTVPPQFETQLLATLKDTAAEAHPEGPRGDAILRRIDGDKGLPIVICAAGFDERKRAMTALADTDGDAGGAPRSPLAPVYSLWERVD
jgi:hypothetical protein